MTRPRHDIPPKARDAESVVQWRRLELLRCGFSLALAARVAEDQRYDLRELIELVARGCSPKLAVQILSPLDGRDRLADAGE
jgi:hypothetical protein